MKKKVTIKDIAKYSNVSTATVSRVLNNNGYVSKEARLRVEEAIKKLNYRPNAIAKSLKLSKTNLIGIIVPDISNDYFMKIVKSIEDIVEKKGYNLLICSSNENSEKEANLLEILHTKRVEVIVLASASGNNDLINRIYQSGTPIILIDRYLEGLDIDYIGEDNVGASYLLTKKVIGMGYKRIGVINGPLNVSTGIDRFKGFKMAMENYGLEIIDEFIFEGDFTKKSGLKAKQYFLSLNKLPEAIISFNNKMTFGLLESLTDESKDVKENLCIASYGKIEGQELFEQYNLISISQKPHEIGLSTGKILLERIKNKNSYVKNYIKLNEIVTSNKI